MWMEKIRMDVTFVRYKGEEINYIEIRNDNYAEKDYLLIKLKNGKEFEIWATGDEESKLKVFGEE